MLFRSGTPHTALFPQKLVHYNSTHVTGTTGGNTDNMIESLKLTAAGRINPAVMVTHISGLDSAADTTLNLPKIPGGKKLIYTHLSMPLTALTDLRTKGEAEGDNRLIVLMDSSKLGLKCSFHICSLDVVDILVSDGNRPEDFLEECEKHNIEIL